MSSGLLLFACPFVLNAAVLFQEDFSTPGTTLDPSRWTTEIGPGSFLGRTQLTNWATGGGQFVSSAGLGELRLDTFNPTGFSLFGTHAKTIQTFQPTANSTIDLTVRLRVTSLQQGLVFALYFYGCVPGLCATNHDEIDIEIVTNFLQGPAGSLQLQTNRYANEPLGAGNGVVVNLPAAFDPLAFHDWTIRWTLNRLDYLVDGVLLFSTTTHVPQGPMQANIIAWAPSIEWAAAYYASLQPVGAVTSNQSFLAQVDSVNVTEITVPEPGFGPLAAALAALWAIRARRARAAGRNA